jgi:hypothetical protein
MQGPDDRDGSGRGNAAGLVAVGLLAVVAYFVLHNLQHVRTYQRCLDAGSINCVDFALRSAGQPRP